MKQINRINQVGYYRPLVKDKDRKIRNKIKNLCLACNFASKGGIETMVFEAGLPIVEANLRSINQHIESLSKSAPQSGD